MKASPYRIVWTIVMFDLPTRTPKNKRDYREFREMLLENGFTMMQYSVYGRSSMTEEKAAVYEKRVHDNIPDDGEVRVLQITEKQLMRMKIWYGKIPKEPEKAALQLELF